MISFFTIPREFNDKYNDIQIAAIQSWLSVDDDVEVWLVGNDSGVGKVSDFLGPRVHHIPGINRSPWKTPLIDDAFYQVTDVASHDILCYVNTDIFFAAGIKETVELVWDMFYPSTGWVITGRRFDADEKYIKLFLAGYPLPSNRIQGEYHCRHGEDYFIFGKEVYGHRGHIPPFAVGRSAWDNWLLMDAQNRKMETIDATGTIDAMHLGATKCHHIANDEYKYNQRLWRENGGRDRAGWVDSTGWITKPGKLIPVVLHHRKVMNK